MPSKEQHFDTPDTGQGGQPFEGACIFRMDTLASISAATPDSRNWKILGGGTIGGGSWNGQTAPNLNAKMIRANSSAGGQGGGFGSHQHSIPRGDEVESTPCSGSGQYLVDGASTGSSTAGGEAYYDLELWMRIQ